MYAAGQHLDAGNTKLCAPGAAAAEGAVLGRVAGVGAERGGTAAGARWPRTCVWRRTRRGPATHMDTKFQTISVYHQHKYKNKTEQLDCSGSQCSPMIVTFSLLHRQLWNQRFTHQWLRKINKPCFILKCSVHHFTCQKAGNSSLCCRITNISNKTSLSFASTSDLT